MNRKKMIIACRVNASTPFYLIIEAKIVIENKMWVIAQPYLQEILSYLWPRIHLGASILICRTRACQQTCSSLSQPLYHPSILYFISSVFSSRGMDGGVFITLVISCCSVLTFPALVGLAAAGVITRLATSPQFLCSLPPCSPSSRFSPPSSLGAHQGQAQVSAVELAHVLSVWPRVCLSKAAPHWCVPWNVTAICRHEQEEPTISERLELLYYFHTVHCLPVNYLFDPEQRSLVRRFMCF